MMATRLHDATNGYGKKGRALVRIVLFMFLATVLGACGSADDGPPPNIVLITLDTTRSDHLSVYGYGQRTTPFLEEFAAEGTIFTEAYSSAPATAPSHATLFTSLSPLTHRVVRNAVALGEHHETMAELLGERGYQTAAVLSSFVMNAKFGQDQGFDFYDDKLDPRVATIRRPEWEGQQVVGGFDRRANETTDHAVEWLREIRTPDGPFFLFIHYFDPHDPYQPPPKYRDRFIDMSVEKLQVRRMRSMYDGEIAYTDDQVRRLCAHLDSLGLADDTLVIVTGDHGEGLMQRNYQYHGAHIYEEAVRVPLLVRWPGRVTPGRRLAGPVTIADVLPTVFDLAGLAQPDHHLQGRSLADVLLGAEPADAGPPIFLYRIPYEPHDELGVWVDGEKHAVRHGDWKYMVAENEGTTELYDLARDPAELENVIGAWPERAERLAAMLADWRAAVTRSDSLDTQPALSEADKQKLRALGYAD